MNRAHWIAVAGAFATLSAPAGAKMVGIVLSVRQTGGFTLVDVYAGVNDPANHCQSVVANSVTTDNAGGFRQGSSVLQKGWGPDIYNLTSTMDSVDSFCTLGQVWTGSAWAAPDTIIPLQFASGSWAGSSGGPPATTFPAGGGWYAGQGEYLNQMGVSLDGLAGRLDGPTFDGAPPAQYGVWLLHLVLATTAPRAVSLDLTVQWDSIHPVDESGDTRIVGNFVVPAPAATMLLLPAFSRSRRRRAAC